MTDPIQHLRELLAKATPGPWQAHSHFSEAGVAVALIGDATIRAVKAAKHGHDWDDAHFIVALRNAAPALLAVAEAARKVSHPERGCAGSDGGCVHCVLKKSLTKLDEVKP